MEPQEALEDTIVHRVHEIFDSLPKRCKPRDLPNGRAEWVPLSAIATTDGM